MEPVLCNLRTHLSAAVVQDEPVRVGNIVGRDHKRQWAVCLRKAQGKSADGPSIFEHCETDELAAFLERTRMARLFCEPLQTARAILTPNEEAGGDPHSRQHHDLVSPHCADLSDWIDGKKSGVVATSDQAPATETVAEWIESHQLDRARLAQERSRVRTLKGRLTSKRFKGSVLSGAGLLLAMNGCVSARSDYAASY